MSGEPCRSAGAWGVTGRGTNEDAEAGKLNGLNKLIELNGVGSDPMGKDAERRDAARKNQAPSTKRQRNPKLQNHKLQPGGRRMARRFAGGPGRATLRLLWRCGENS